MATIVTGLTDGQLFEHETRAEQAMLTALQTVADQVADQVAASHVASARIAWDGCPRGFHDSHTGPCPDGGGLAVLVAADPPPVPDIPGPAGQPYVSPDDLARITPLWAEQVDRTLIPVVAEVYQTQAGTVYAQMVSASGIATLPPIPPLAAQQYLVQAQSTFEQVGGALWENARSQLLDGFADGDSIPELAARVRGAAQMTAPTATLVARTQILDASNAASIGTARASGLALRKGWFATLDLRTRPDHLTAEATYGHDAGFIPLAEPFIVGGESCDRPHDPVLSPAQRYSCRCSIGYLVSAQSATPVRQAVQPPLPGQSGIPTPPLPLPPPPTPPAVQAAFNRAMASAAATEQRALAAAQAAYSRALRVAQQTYERQLRVAGQVQARAEQAAAQQAARDLRRAAARVAHSERRAAEQAARLERDATLGRPALAQPGPAAPPLTGLPPGPSVRSVLATARTPDQLATAMREEVRRITGREVVVEIPPDASIASIREFYQGLLSGMERYPDTPLRAISWFQAEGGHYAEASTDRILVNGWWTSRTRRPAFVAKVRSDVAGWAEGRNGWMPRQAGTIDALGSHEYGHVVHKSLGADTSVVSSRALTAAQRHAAAEGITPDTLVARELGAYATSDEMELVAGAFTDVAVNGPAASQLSREIVDELSAAYRRAGRTIGIEPAPTPIGPAALAAPSRTVAQLRAAVTQRGLIVPVGLRQPALRALVDDLERGIAPATARETAVRTILTERESIGSALAEAAEMAASGGSARALRFLGTQIRRRLDVDATKLARPLLEALEAGDADTVRAALPLVARAGKLKAVGGAGDILPLDAARMTRIDSSGAVAARADDVVRRESVLGGPMSAAEFDVRARAARTGTAAENLPPVLVRVDASAGVDVARWRAVEATGLEGPQAPLLSAATSRVRTSGLANPRLRGDSARRIEQREAMARVGLGPTPEQLTRTAASADREIAALDRAMAQSRLPSDAVVWRFGRPTGVTFPEGSAVGVEWADLGFVGTSAQRSVAESFATGDRTLMRILAPEGTPAIGIQGGGEAEVLLGRGLRFRVVGESRTGTGTRVLDVEIVPATTARAAGGAVRVIRPGFETTFEGKTVLVRRADVVGATPAEMGRLAPVKAVKAAPAKKAAAPAQDLTPEIRPELMRARSMPKLVEAAEAEVERVTGRTGTGRFRIEPGWSVDTAREHIEGILRGLERYPQVEFGLRRQLRGIDSGQFFVRAHRITGVIEVNDEFVTTAGRAAYLARIAKNRERRWFTQAQDSPTGVTAHEFGHIIDDAVLEGRAHARIEELVKQMAAEAGVSERRFVYDQLSEYATMDTAELVGESFAEVLMRGGSAPLLARRVIAIIDDEYVKAGFRLGTLRTAPTAVKAAKKAAAPVLDTAEVRRVTATLERTELQREVTRTLAGQTSEAGQLLTTPARQARHLRLTADAETGGAGSAYRAVPTPANAARLAQAERDAARLRRIADGIEGRLTPVKAARAAVPGTPRQGSLWTAPQRKPVRVTTEGMPGRAGPFGEVRTVHGGTSLVEGKTVLEHARIIAGLPPDDVAAYLDWHAFKRFELELLRHHQARLVSGDVKMQLGANIKAFPWPMAETRELILRDAALAARSATAEMRAAARAYAAELATPASRAAKAVKAAPAKKAAAPKPPPGPDKLTLPALKAELQRAIDAAPAVSRLDLAGVPKPTLVQWATRARELPPSQLAEEVGRWRQVVIDRRRAVAEALAEADELLANGATATQLGARARARLARVEALVKGWPDEVALRSLVTAMSTGNPASIRRAIAAARRKVGLEQVGPDAGKIGRYDSGSMSPISGARIADGVPVRIVRPGYEVEVGGRRVVLSRPVVEEFDAMAARDAEVAARRTKLADAIQQPSKPGRGTGSGGSADVKVRVAEDGTKYVVKTYTSTSGRAVENADREELASAVAHALGLRAPVIVRAPGSATLRIEWMAGKEGWKVGIPSRAVVESDDGRLMGLFSALTRDLDRGNPGNWLLARDGHLTAIDFGMAFWTDDAAGLGIGGTNAFGEYLFAPGIAGRGYQSVRLLGSIDVAPEDLAIIRQRLEALRGQFQSRGQIDWWRIMMSDLQQLERAATPGARRLLT